MKLLSAIDARIEALESQIAKEDEATRQAIAAKQIVDGKGYWKKRHALQMRLDAARAFREALMEARS